MKIIIFVLQTFIGIGFVFAGRYIPEGNFWGLVIVYFIGYLLMDVWADLKNKNE